VSDPGCDHARRSIVPRRRTSGGHKEIKKAPIDPHGQVAKNAQGDQDFFVPTGRLDALLAYVTAERRVCPMPGAWDELWHLLGRRSLPPLILAAWGSPWYAKRRQLDAQIRYAAEHGLLGRVDRYLRSLPPDAWEGVSEETMRLEPEPLIYRLVAEKSGRPSTSFSSAALPLLSLPQAPAGAGGRHGLVASRSAAGRDRGRAHRAHGDRGPHEAAADGAVAGAGHPVFADGLPRLLLGLVPDPRGRRVYSCP
jgi:hypothetical protein